MTNVCRPLSVWPPLPRARGGRDASPRATCTGYRACADARFEGGYALTPDSCAERVACSHLRGLTDDVETALPLACGAGEAACGLTCGDEESCYEAMLGCPQCSQGHNAMDCARIGVIRRPEGTLCVLKGAAATCRRGA